MTDFKINFLDHVAIRVKDLNFSAQWYQKVLGLTILQPKEWKPFPILLLAGQSGIALFPADLNDKSIPLHSKNRKIDHFAFNVSNQAFQKVQQHLQQLNIPFEFQDHHYFCSIYIKDPDGHTVELTTLVVNPKDFFPSS